MSTSTSSSKRKTVDAAAPSAAAVPSGGGVDQLNPLPGTCRTGGEGRLGLGQSFHSIRSTKSDCFVQNHSIKFRPDELSAEWFDDSSFSGDSGSMEVMDLRPSAHHAVRHMETCSLVSLGSNSSSIASDGSNPPVANPSELSALRISKMPSSLFAVANNGGDGGSKGSKGSKESIDEGGDAMPTHWEEAVDGDDDEEEEGGFDEDGKRPGRCQSRKSAKGRHKGSLSVRISSNGRFLLGESEQAYRALMSLMGGNADDGDPGILGRLEGGSSSGSDGSDKSGYWSALGEAASSIISGGSASCATKESETSPLTRERRAEQRRRQYLRRCVRGVVGVVVLAGLAATAMYLVADDDELPGNGLWGRLFGDTGAGEGAREGEGERRLLPEDGAAAEYWVARQDVSYGNNFPQERISPDQEYRQEPFVEGGVR